MKKFCTIILSLIIACCSVLLFGCNPQSSKVNENTSPLTLTSDKVNEGVWNKAMPTEMYDSFSVKVSLESSESEARGAKMNYNVKLVQKSNRILTYAAVEAIRGVSSAVEDAATESPSTPSPSYQISELYVEYTPDTVNAYERYGYEYESYYEEAFVKISDERIEASGISYESAFAQCLKPLFKIGELTYSDFTWDENDKCYRYDELVYTTLNLISSFGLFVFETTEPLRNLKVKIVDGNIAGVTGEACYGQGTEHETVFPFTFLLYDVGKTSITLPQI